MSYGEIKIDTITFTAGGVDTSIAVSGLVQNPTFTGNITTTGTITADVVIGTTLVSGATVTGTTANFVTVSGTTALGNTARFITVSGTTVTGTQANFIGVSGTTITGAIGRFTNVTGVNIVGTTLVSGDTVTGNIGSFTTLTGGTVNLTSGVFASGTAAAPSVSIGTTDNGLYSPGADQVAISTNGTGRLFIDASGRVGINTGSPSNALQVESSADSNQGIFIRNTSTGSSASSNVLINSDVGQLILRSHSSTHGSWPATATVSSSSGLTGGLALNTGAAAPLAFLTNNSERLRITSAGLVGVGTSSPVSVTGFGTLFTVANNSGGGIVLQDANTTVGYRNKYIASVDGEIHFGKCADDGTSPTTQVLLDHNGRLGVGTTSPPALCSIAGPGVAGNVGRLLQVYAASASGAGSGSEIWLGWNPSTLSTGGGVTIGGVYNGSGTDILFSTPADTSSAPTEKVRIDSSGRVGIGTSSPSSTLNVVAQSDTAGGDGITLGNSTGNRKWLTRFGTNTNLGLYQDFWDGATWNTRLALTYTGNLGIGTTNGTAGLSVLTYGTQLGAGANTYMTPSGRHHVQFGNVANGTDVYAGFTSDYATTSGSCNIVLQPTFNNTSQQAGAYVAGEATGLAATAITFGHFNGGATIGSNATKQERARIDSSGRLLVGTSSNRTGSSSNLQIEGTSYNSSSASFIRNENDGSGPSVVLGKSRGGTVNSYTVVQSGDALGTIQFTGSDGTTDRQAAFIQGFVDGTPGTNDMPGRLVFSTTADGASSPTERARITSGGYFKASYDGTYVSTTGGYHEFSGNSANSYDLKVRNRNSTPLSEYILELMFSASTPNDGNARFIDARDATAQRFYVLSNGGIGNYSANNSNLSDINAKKDISPAAGTWDCIKEWEIVNYRYKDQPDDADLNLGVIAQQVAESCPEVITVFQEAKEATEDQPAQEERLGVKEQQMYWMAIKALQEAQVRIEQLEAKVAALESA